MQIIICFSKYSQVLTLWEKVIACETSSLFVLILKIETQYYPITTPFPVSNLIGCGWKISPLQKSFATLTFQMKAFPEYFESTLCGLPRCEFGGIELSDQLLVCRGLRQKSCGGALTRVFGDNHSCIHFDETLQKVGYFLNQVIRNTSPRNK